MGADDKHAFAQQIAQLDQGIGYPVVLEKTGEYIIGPAQLIERLNELASTESEGIVLSSLNAEDDVLFEEFISGQEFSCGVIQDDTGTAIALPPTEVYNVDSFDFASKYLSNVTKKRIPVDTSLENNRKIQLAVSDVFSKLGINVYSRIDGFLTADGRVLLHDPNTIPGMSPASLIFKQMAEIGLNLTHSLTYLIRQSLRERIRTGKDTYRLKLMLSDIDGRLAARKANPQLEELVTFGPSDEAFVAAKATYNGLAAEGAVRPVLVFEKGEGEEHRLPVSALFKDTIADLELALSQTRHPLLTETEERAKHIVDTLI
jgi:D-alanine-D-alanine ligase